MKPSEIINNAIMSHGGAEGRKIEKLILDEMAEDIKYLKGQVNNPFPFMCEKPKEREWEK